MNHITVEDIKKAALKASTAATNYHNEMKYNDVLTVDMANDMRKEIADSLHDFVSKCIYYKAQQEGLYCNEDSVLFEDILSDWEGYKEKSTPAVQMIFDDVEELHEMSPINYNKALFTFTYYTIGVLFAEFLRLSPVKEGMKE